MKTILPIFLLFFIGLVGTAQSKVTVNGYVENQDHKLLVAASLSFISLDNIFTATTDSSGKYAIVIPEGCYKIEVRYLGYITHSTSEAIKANRSLNFTLNRDGNDLKEVLVISNSNKALAVAAGNRLSFNPEKLKAIPSLMGVTDIIKILQLTPGVQNSGDANGYLYVRGSDPGHNLMLYADTPVYGMAHLLGVFPFYNGDHIKEVQFDKSSTNPAYGGRLSAAVAVVPNRKLPADFSIKGTIGLLASQATAAIPISDKVGLYISGRKTYIDEVVAPLFDSPKKNENSDVKDLKYTFGDGNMTFIAAIFKKQLFTVDAFISGDVLKINESNLALNAKLKWSNIVITPSWKYSISENVDLTNTIYFTQYKNNLQLEQATIAMDIASYVKDIGFSNVLKYSVFKIPFESGVQYAMHELLPQKIEVSNLSTATINQEAEINKAKNLAVFSSAKPKVFENLTAELGLRLNYYTSDKGKTTYLHLEPRFLLNYEITSNNSIFLSYTRKNQYLNLITTSSVGIPTDFWVASASGIPSQSSDEYAIGYNQKIKRQFDLSINSFYRSMKNLIEYPYGLTQFNEITSFKNDFVIGKGESYGLEFMFKKDLGKFKGWISYTLSWSDRQFDKLNNGERYFAKYDRRHNLAIVGTYDINAKWDFGMTQIFSSGSRFTTPTSWYFINNNPVKEYGKYNNAQMPNYIRTDLSVSYYLVKTRLKESAINFSIFNTFNIENPIYTVLNVIVDENRQKIEVKPERKTLYSILPSISWRFKF